MKNKFFTAVVLLLVLSSCAAYLDMNSTPSDQGYTIETPAPLQGTINSDTANDTDPFLFRDSNGSARLIFASDRDNSTGRYDIYMAVMNTSNRFDNPVKINFASADGSARFPVVYYQEDDSSVIRLHMTVLQGNYTLTWELDSSFQPVTPPQSNLYMGATGIGLMKSTNQNSTELLVTFDSATVNRYYFDIGNYNWSTVPDPTLFFTGRMRGVSGFSYNDSVLDIIYRYYIGTDARKVIYSGVSTYNNAISSGPVVPYYNPSFRDESPFMDAHNGAVKVYFASDRYGRGNMDIYRYNHSTDQVIFRLSRLTAMEPGVFVSTAGSDTNDGLTPETPIRNIQQGLDLLAVNADLINLYIAEGTYTPGNGLSSGFNGVMVTNSNKSILGGMVDNFTRQGGHSVLDMNGNGRPMWITGAYSVNLSRLILKNGQLTDTGDGAGLYINNSAFVTLQNVRIMSNYLFDGYGAGMSVINSSNILFQGRIMDNNGNGYGAALAIMDSDNITVTNSILTNNYVYSGAPDYVTTLVYLSVSQSPSYRNISFTGNLLGSTPYSYSIAFYEGGSLDISGQTFLNNGLDFNSLPYIYRDLKNGYLFYINDLNEPSTTGAASAGGNFLFNVPPPVINPETNFNPDNGV